MRKLTKKASAILSIGCPLLLILTGLLYLSGGRINTSSSIPIGLYWIKKDPIQIGEYVIFCPPQNELFKEALIRGYIDSGFCPSGFGYMMKRVLALHGDTVSINPLGVWVNNQFIGKSMPYKKDEQGRLMPKLNLHDARYFGLIKQNQVKAVIKPVFTWTTIS